MTFGVVSSYLTTFLNCAIIMLIRKFRRKGEIMRDRNKSADLLKAFRQTRNQVEKSYIQREEVKPKKPFSRGAVAPSKALSFDDKYNNLEATIDTFTAVDLTYFFQKKSNEAGIKYVIANHARDGAVFKKLLKSYSSREICLMIEFLFDSNQNYLDKTSLQPTVLVSSWCNTIYRDSLLWVDDKYSPRPPKSNSRQKREWERETDTDSAKIGEWE